MVAAGGSPGSAAWVIVSIVMGNALVACTFDHEIAIKQPLDNHNTDAYLIG